MNNFIDALLAGIMLVIAIIGFWFVLAVLNVSSADTLDYDYMYVLETTRMTGFYSK